MKKVFVWLILAVMLASAFACKVPSQDKATIPDGTYRVAVTLEGGSGKATIESPAKLIVEGGKLTLSVVWSSDKYDYMLVGGEKYLPEITDGHSVFTIPAETLDKPLKVVADTTAMSTPHEIEYQIVFDASTLTPAS